ncbi:tyrosine-type recombinase/integrase [Hoyosella altamirensis]|uniref:Integrase n=1 Tax=Hoyosella altamirensis TaxID=616997 RepID=A0A839RT23_9ACTN|nr:tyrosine-type recombinase/integrase [Hoyosella altamirensis]MBB3038991.1 integrase [Hoyosella altamirensis]
MARQQLPPQIRKITVTDRRTSKKVPRYQVTVDTGTNDEGRRKQTRKRFTTEKDARDYLASTQAAVAAGTYVSRSKRTVRQAIDEWLASKHNLKASTLRGHQSKLSAVTDELGNVEVQRLSKANLDDLVRRLRAGEVEGRSAWSPRSVNYMLSILTSALESEVQQGNVARNVAALVERVDQSGRTEMKTLTEGQMFRILDHECEDRHLWALALYGLRRGEIAGLRWSKVDLKAGAVTIDETKVVVEREVLVGTPKSKRSRRTLPMPADVIEVLRAARKRQLEDRMIAGSTYGSGEYVASDQLGQPLHPDAITSRWEKLLKVLGIPAVRLHDARHSCATLMHLRGVPIAVIAAWLGHASAAFTMATYAHSQDDALKAAASSFGRVVTTRDTETGSDA